MEQCDCLAGQGGAFCKHLCAVHVQSGIYLKNSPALSFEDRIQLAKLAMGTVDESFFLGLAKDANNSVEVESRDNFQMSMSYQRRYDQYENDTTSDGQLGENENDGALDNFERNTTPEGNIPVAVGTKLLNNIQRILAIAEENRPI